MRIEQHERMQSEEALAFVGTRFQNFGSDFLPRAIKSSITLGSVDCYQTKKDETLTCSLAGHRKSLYKPNTHSSCLHDMQ